MPAGTPTLPQVFREAGYQTAAVGKLHVYPQRDRIGFDEVILNEEGRHHLGGGADDWELFLAAEGFPGQEYAGGMCNNDYMVRPWHLPEHTHQTVWTAREMCRMIRRRDPRKPGFWYMSFNAPHPPVNPPAPYLDLYRHAEIDLPVWGDWSQRIADMPYALQVGAYKFAMAHATEEEMRWAKRGWYATLTHIDHQIRVVLGYLREEGLIDNTILGFTADHGDMLGDHHQWAKGVMFDAAAKIPLLLVPPRGEDHFAPSSRDDRLVELRDVMPTLLEMAGLAIPDSVEGHSLLGSTRRPYLYGEHHENDLANRMIREQRYKLIYWPVGNSVQLFDLEEDPREQHDLADEPAHRDTRERLERLLVEEMYGGDVEWVREGRLVGLPHREAQPQDVRRLVSQRGLRFL
jgi:arylsulfatase A-like enzyme